MRDELRTGRLEAAASSTQRGCDCKLGGRARGGAHFEHAAHARDAGGVEAQRLVERRRVLPACGAGRDIPGSGREAAGDRGASSVQGRAQPQIRGRARVGLKAAGGTELALTTPELALTT